MSDLVSINQVRDRFSGREDAEFEIATDASWGNVAVTLSIYRQIMEDGTITLPTAEMQFLDRNGEAISQSYLLDDNSDNISDLDIIAELWRIDVDDPVWDITLEGPEDEE